MVDAKNKWTLITGASRGIGYLSALFMAKQGCNLVLHSRSTEHCSKVEAEVKALGADAYSVSADLAEPTQVSSMLDEIEAKGTQIDIILNNAAVQIGYRANIWDTPVEDFDVSFRINVTAIAIICHRLMPGMIERDFGRIVNTTSGVRDQPEMAGYASSKAALDKFNQDLATKVEGTNVSINLTDPGWCRTDLGGEQAPNDPSYSLPGVVVGAFIDDKKSGRLLGASHFEDMTLEEAVAKAATLTRD